MSVVSLSARALVRYAVPLLVLSAIVFAPLAWLAFGLKTPASPGQALATTRTTYVLAAASVFPLLVLVGGAAPLVRSLVDQRPLSQLRALGAGLGGLVHALVPCALAVAAVVLGGLALVVPGVLLLLLVSLTGASTGETATSRVRGAIELARPQLGRIALVLGLSCVAYAIAIVLAQRGLVPVPKKPSAAQLAAYPQLARTLLVGALLVAPVPAVVLAALAARAPSGR